MRAGAKGVVVLFPLLLGAGARPVVLRHDDGTQEDRRSMAGTGQAVRFARPSETFALAGVRIYGSRYGHGYDPFLEVAQVSICDASLEPLTTTHVPLEKFPFGSPKWVDVPLQPLKPPETFYVLVDFFATRTKGVYLGIDAGAKGHSVTGTPGRPGGALGEGGWMIRAVGTRRPAPSLVLDPATRRALSHDDGEPDGRRSMAGSGHAVLFSAPSGTWYLAEVAVHGSLYGGGYDPARTLFHIFVCDPRMRVLSRSAHPYALFARGEAKWVTVKVPRVRVRGKFFVLVAFQPTQTRGVYVSIDRVGRPHSLSAMPNRVGRALRGEEWMIRAALMRRGRGGSAGTAKREEPGLDAMRLAEARSRLDLLEEKEDAAGMRRVVAGIARLSEEAARELGKVYATRHVFVRYTAVPDAYARAVAELLEACDAALKKDFGIEGGIATVRGKRLHVHMRAEKGTELRLWTSPGSAKFPLIVNTMPSWERGLAPPSEGGPHVVYGYCHELGHVLMGWEDDRHRWAHCVGSILVDAALEARGAKIWPRPYDVRAEGLARLRAEVEEAKPDRSSDAGTARIFYDVGEAFGLRIWGRALAWIRANRAGKPLGAVRLYRLDDLRDALLALGCDAGKVRAIFGP